LKIIIKKSQIEIPLLTIKTTNTSNKKQGKATEKLIKYHNRQKVIEGNHKKKKKKKKKKKDRPG